VIAALDGVGILEICPKALLDGDLVMTLGFECQGYELISAEPSDNVRFAKSLLEQTRRSDERLVSSLVSEVIVDVLEVVQVAIEQNGAASVSGCQGQ